MFYPSLSLRILDISLIYNMLTTSDGRKHIEHRRSYHLLKIIFNKIIYISPIIN